MLPIIWHLTSAKIEDDNILIETLDNGVLIHDLDFLLQGSTLSHALVKINISEIDHKTKEACEGVKIVKKFVLDKSNYNYKQIKVVNEIKPLIKTLEDLCKYSTIKSRILFKSFECKIIL